SLTRNVLPALISRVHCPKYLKLLKPRLPTSPGLGYCSITSPGVPSGLALARARMVQTDCRLVPILSPAVTDPFVHCGSATLVNWLPNTVPAVAPCDQSR